MIQLVFIIFSNCEINNLCSLFLLTGAQARGTNAKRIKRNQRHNNFIACSIFSHIICYEWYINIPQYHGNNLNYMFIV